VSERRRVTIPPSRDTGSELPKSIELETRVARLEFGLEDLRRAVDVLTRRMVAMQAQLDHLSELLLGRR
jgi:hypothetical protein